jgi:hypothetical protein
MASMRRVKTVGDDWLEVIRLDRLDWRVSDLRVDQADAGHLLGYIERVHRDRYELFWIIDPVRWSYVKSFAAAVEGFADGRMLAGATQDERDGFVVTTAPAPSRHALRSRATALVRRTVSWDR